MNQAAEKHLLIVYHTQSGSTQAMAEAVIRGVRHPEVSGIELRIASAFDAGVDDLLWAEALIFGTPENFGYMSGALKDFFDRTFYPTQGKVEGLPFAVFIKGGNDGSGALSAIRRIAKGYPLREVQPPIVCRGALTEETLARCEELGTLMAAGLELGMY